MEVISETRVVPFIGTGDLVHNKFFEALENGMMVQYTVSVLRRLLGREDVGKAPIIFDSYTVTTTEEVFHYGQRISKREVIKDTIQALWTIDSIVIIDPTFVSQKAIGVLILGKGAPFKGPAVPNEKELPIHESRGYKIEETLESQKKEGKLVDKFMPEKFVVGIAGSEALLKAATSKLQL